MHRTPLILAALVAALALAGCVRDRVEILDRWLDDEAHHCLDAVAYRRRGDVRPGDPYREYLFMRITEGELSAHLEKLRAIHVQRDPTIKDVQARDAMRRKIDTCLMLITTIRQDAALGPAERRGQINELEGIIADTIDLYSSE